jgi:hypothetical protein
MRSGFKTPAPSLQTPSRQQKINVLFSEFQGTLSKRRPLEDAVHHVGF